MRKGTCGVWGNRAEEGTRGAPFPLRPFPTLPSLCGAPPYFPLQHVPFAPRRDGAHSAGRSMGQEWAMQEKQGERVWGEHGERVLGTEGSMGEAARRVRGGCRDDVQRKGGCGGKGL